MERRDAFDGEKNKIRGELNGRKIKYGVDSAISNQSTR